MSSEKVKLTSLEDLLEHCLTLEFNDSAFLIFKRLYGKILDDIAIPQRFEDLMHNVAKKIGDSINYWDISNVKASESQVDLWVEGLSSLIDRQNQFGIIEWRIAFSDRLSKYFEVLLDYYLENRKIVEALELFDNILCKELIKEIDNPYYRKASMPSSWQQLIETKKEEISQSEFKLIESLRKYMSRRIRSMIFSSKEIDNYISNRIHELCAMEWAERNNWRIEKHKQTIHELNLAEQEVLLYNKTSIKTTNSSDLFTPTHLADSILCLQYAYIEPTARLVSMVTLNGNLIFEKVIPFDLYYLNRLIHSFYYCLDMTTALGRITILNDGKEKRNYKDFVILLENKIRDISKELGKILIFEELDALISQYKDKYVSIASYGVINYIPWEALITPELGRLGCTLKLTRMGSQNVLKYLAHKYSQKKKYRSAAIFFDDKALSFSRKEAMEIAKIFEDSGWECRLFSGDKFTARNFVETVTLESWDIVHFIGHGQFVAESSSLSNIRFHNSILTAKEISRVSFTHGSLVFLDACVNPRSSLSSSFLNACETAKASHRKLEPEGLWRSILGGGSTNFIGCNWEVYDDVAAHSGKLFYENLIKHKMTVADALLKVRKVISEKPLKPNFRVKTLEDSVYALYGLPYAIFD